MLERLTEGELPAKHHLMLRGAAGELRHEECLTRDGFDGPYTILYHVHRPHALRATGLAPTAVGVRAAGADVDHAPRSLQRRHFRSSRAASTGAPLHARTALLFNDDLTLSRVQPNLSDVSYAINADADELLFIRSGSGILRTALGDLPYAPLDYLFVPRGLLYRFELMGDMGHDYLSIACKRGLDVPPQWRNQRGQLRMDAPYCHRDFRRPTFTGPRDEGIRELAILRNDLLYSYQLQSSPLDVVGWDGTVYPWAFPMLAFQPRVSSVHLPPTWHGTFAAGGALICSFVPRPLDFHPDAIPCPYPHSNVDIDEVLYYVSGQFTSRAGVGPGSLTLHPRGIPHGPQPGKYEASIGATRTDEVAVMLDCQQPLTATRAAAVIEDEGYEASFL